MERSIEQHRVFNKERINAILSKSLVPTKTDIYDVFHAIDMDYWNRFPLFLRIAPVLSNQMYWYALQTAYTDSSNLYRHRIEVIESFSKTYPFRYCLMDSKERKFLKNLPEEITIYRGMTILELESKQYGVSWSLEKERAEFFAYSFGRNEDTDKFPKTVHSMTIKKSQAIAYFGGRKEFEIIYVHEQKA